MIENNHSIVIKIIGNIGFIKHYVLSLPGLLSAHQFLTVPGRTTQHSNLGPYFLDGQRRADYVLTYHEEKPQNTHHKSSNSCLKNCFCCGKKRNPANSAPQHDLENPGNDERLIRKEFEQKLMDMGLELEKDEEEVSGLLSFVELFYLRIM